MQLVKICNNRNEIFDELEKSFGKDIAEDMLRATERNGMSAYGKYMVRKVGRDYLLFMLNAWEVKKECSTAQQ